MGGGLVIDASVVLSWLLPDERTDAAQRIVGMISESFVQAPSLLALEVASALLLAERRRRISSAVRGELLETFAMLPIALDAGDAGTAIACAELASRHGLSVYDAAYMELAQRRRFRIATFDRTLARAAERETIVVVDGARQRVTPTGSAPARSYSGDEKKGAPAR